MQSVSALCQFSEPKLGRYVPAGQCKQADSDVAPVEVRYLPRGQTVQAGVPPVE